MESNMFFVCHDFDKDWLEFALKRIEEGKRVSVAFVVSSNDNDLKWASAVLPNEDNLRVSGPGNIFKEDYWK